MLLFLLLLLLLWGRRMKWKSYFFYYYFMLCCGCKNVFNVLGARNHIWQRCLCPSSRGVHVYVWWQKKNIIIISIISPLSFSLISLDFLPIYNTFNWLFYVVNFEINFVNNSQSWFYIKGEKIFLTVFNRWDTFIKKKELSINLIVNIFFFKKRLLCYHWIILFACIAIY